jgi:hypothetical protein
MYDSIMQPIYDATDYIKSVAKDIPQNLFHLVQSALDYAVQILDGNKQQEPFINEIGLIIEKLKQTRNRRNWDLLRIFTKDQGLYDSAQYFQDLSDSKNAFDNIVSRVNASGIKSDKLEAIISRCETLLKSLEENV